MIKPTVGRVVWFWPGDKDRIPHRKGEPLSAQIAAINSDRNVNLGILDVDGIPRSRVHVPLAQEGDAVEVGESYCEWMPYQKGQAAKTEAAERALAPHREDAAQAPNRTPADGFSFSAALFHLKRGERVARAGWNGKGMFLFLVPGSRFKVNRPPLLGIYPEGTEIDYHAHIDMKTAQGYVVPWLASQSDMLADDWHVVA